MLISLAEASSLSEAIPMSPRKAISGAQRSNSKHAAGLLSESPSIKESTVISLVGGQWEAVTLRPQSH